MFPLKKHSVEKENIVSKKSHDIHWAFYSDVDFKMHITFLKQFDWLSVIFWYENTKKVIKNFELDRNFRVEAKITIATYEVIVFLPDIFLSGNVALKMESLLHDPPYI